MNKPEYIKVRYINGRWKADLVCNCVIMTQLRREAGLNQEAWPDPADAYDRILFAAGKHGIGLETEDETTPAPPPTRLFEVIRTETIRRPVTYQVEAASPEDAVAILRGDVKGRLFSDHSSEEDVLSVDEDEEVTPI